MNKALIITLLALTACGKDVLVTNYGEPPISFSVEKKNITRSANSLESLGHYNFGVWAYKYNSTTTQLVMDNYLVGYSNGIDKGYDNSRVTTYSGDAGTARDNKSPWFYESLGSSEYTYNGTGFYKATQEAYMSKNANQYLRYWDLAYANTNFYAYAPYNKHVTFDEATRTMTFDSSNTIRDGYEEPISSAYQGIDRSLTEFMYAGVKAENAQKEDVLVPFKHMGAQLFIRFYENIPGYKVEIIDLDGDEGNMASNATADMKKGIQAAPATKNGDTYEKSTYFTRNGATVTFNDNAEPIFTPSTAGLTGESTPLMFKIPTEGLSTASQAPSHLTDFDGHKVIREVSTSGPQEYSYSPTIYYPVAQLSSTTGLTFHITYRVIAEDNKEVITVHNATVFVPAADNSSSIASWQPNIKYTYTFKITTGSFGTSDPSAEIDPTDPTPSSTKGLYPIVFDGATIEEYIHV